MKQFISFCIGLQFVGLQLRAAEVQGANPSSHPAVFTADALVREIMVSHPELKFYEAEVAAARGDLRSAGKPADPELSGQIGQKRVRGGGISDEGAAWAVSLQQTFEWPGRVSLRKAIANRQVQLAELGLSQFRAALAARTRVLVLNLFAATEKRSAVQTVADRMRQLREVLVQRDPAGLTPLLETRIIEATELTLQRKAGEAESALQSAALELNQLRGSAWTNLTRVDPGPLSMPPAPPREMLLSAARTNNFDLLTRQAELEQQGLKVSLARKEGYPSVSVGPYYSQERAGEREQQLGVALSMPLPLWNRNRGNVDSAEARRIQAEASLHSAQRNIEREVVEQALLYESKRQEIGRWRPDAIQEFEKAAELADRHYRLGAVPMTTYIELHKQYLDAVEALLETRREALQAAQQLQLLTGLDRFEEKESR